MHSITGRQTDRQTDREMDGWHDDANSQSHMYHVAVQLAKKLIKMEASYVWVLCLLLYQIFKHLL